MKSGKVTVHFEPVMNTIADYRSNHQSELPLVSTKSGLFQHARQAASLFYTMKQGQTIIYKLTIVTGTQL